MSRVPDAIRAAVVAREDGLCAICGQVGTDVHHRQRRAVGGHELWNCVLVCRRCHNYAHGNPVEARSKGWIISVHDKQPWDALIYGWQGAKLLAEDKGTP